MRSFKYDAMAIIVGAFLFGVALTATGQVFY